MSLTPIKDHNGKIIKLLGISKDISALKKTEVDLKERIKELNALYGLSEIVERKGITLDELYQEATNILPSSWQYPEITCCRITINNKEFITENYTCSNWKQTSDILVNGIVAGNIEVIYLEDKPFLNQERMVLDVFAQRLGHIIERMEMDKNKLKEANLKLQELVMYDALTGAINRKPFVDILGQNILRAKREQSMLAVFYIDIDNFKRINDKFGHNIGDKVLQIATSKIRLCLRESDLIGRLGGDEFGICLNNIKSKKNVAVIAKKINHVFNDKIQVYSQSLELTLSIGITLFPEDGDDAEELLKYSDMAMYEIKRTKKNSFRFFK